MAALGENMCIGMASCSGLSVIDTARSRKVTNWQVEKERSDMSEKAEGPYCTGRLMKEQIFAGWRRLE